MYKAICLDMLQINSHFPSSQPKSSVALTTRPRAEGEAGNLQRASLNEQGIFSQPDDEMEPSQQHLENGSKT